MSSRKQSRFASQAAYNRAMSQNQWNELGALHKFYVVKKGTEVVQRFGRDGEERAICVPSLR